MTQPMNASTHSVFCRDCGTQNTTEGKIRTHCGVALGTTALPPTALSNQLSS